MSARRWGPAHYLAGLGLALLAFQAWAVAGWIGDGPHQITEYRDKGATSWHAARIIEAALVLVALAVTVLVVRACRRERRLTFDAMLLIGLAFAALWDPIYNWITPAWLYSSQWLNVNDWFGHAPLVLNPEAGSQPWPVILVGLFYPFGTLVLAVIANRVMAGLRARRPAVSAAALGGVAFAVCTVETAIAFSVMRALDLMNAPGYRVDFLPGPETPLMALSGGLFFGSIACLRFFTDADGRRLPERGLGGAAAPVRRVVGMLATIGACGFAAFFAFGPVTVPASLYSDPYPRLPAHLLNGLCDPPGSSGTDYGPCPGSDGFRLPLRRHD